MKKTHPHFRPFGNRDKCAQHRARIEKAHANALAISNQAVVRLIVATNHWFQTDEFEIGRGLVEFTNNGLRIYLAVTADAADQADFARFSEIVASLDAPVHLERDEYLTRITGIACWQMHLELASGADIDALAVALVQRAEAATEKASCYPHAARVQAAIAAIEQQGGSFKVGLQPVKGACTAYSIQSI